jgi:hypothetical protein
MSFAGVMGREAGDWHWSSCRLSSSVTGRSWRPRLGFRSAEEEPLIQPAPPDDYQRWLTEQRTDFQAARDQAQAAGQDTVELDDLITELDAELRRTGIRGHLGTGKAKPKARRKRSTRPAKTPPTCPGGISTLIRSAGLTPPRRGRPTGRRCSSL